MGLTFLYTIRMIEIIKKNGLLDADFVQPIVGLIILLVIGEVI